MGPDERYGYGFLEQQVNGVRIVGHGGGAPGINAGLDIYPDLGDSVAVLATWILAPRRPGAAPGSCSPRKPRCQRRSGVKGARAAQGGARRGDSLLRDSRRYPDR